MNDNTIIEMSGINKQFPLVKAIDDGKFDLRAGEIHSLIGENGAGKSTMMKILYGVYAPDSGDIRVGDSHYKAMDTKKAIELGIGMVHQEFMLAEGLTVLENIILGSEPKKGSRIDFAKAREKVETYSRDYGLEIDLNKKVIDIPVGEAQRVEIIKTLYRGAKILILDEPTAVLTPQETVNLFKILNALKEDGKSVVFISHKLNEVMEISDRITVMRHGKYIDTANKEDVSIPQLAQMMVGRKVFLGAEKRSHEITDTVLSVKDIYVPSEREHSKIRGISLDIHKGEILGIAGIDGNGQKELAEAVSGLRKVERGAVVLNGKEIQNMNPQKIRMAGLSYIPEDRNVRGMNKSFSIKENLVADCFYKKPYSSRGVLNRKKIDNYAADVIKKYDIRPADTDICIANLSGGNAQKVICAREIDGDFDVLIAAQPTRGVDIGSIEVIRKILTETRDKGKAVLLISADLDEILALSDRIAVIYEGRITGVLKADEATDIKLGLLMTGEEIYEKE
ncbi:MAG TPA: ABC transporter ATP-binding protein [Ruminococcaceae bacterium]|jgi:simple sugar transport system ATP-binding protein|nr:ABC transporter ATP-binding protein [Oscillospiraceae bacterium]